MSNVSIHSTVNRGRSCCLAVLTLLYVVSPTRAQFDLTPPAKSFAEERRQAAAQHDQMVAQFGGVVENEKLVAYINQVGKTIVEHSDMPNEPFVFTTLNSPVVNAWTVGGGYLYITRGMLSVMNSEAELVAVLGHEVGHVTGRHTSRRETKLQRKQYETGLLALLTGNVRLAGAKGLYDVTKLLSYSRRQESDADKTGFQILKKAGYDLGGMTDMLSSLQRYVRLEATMAGQNPDAAQPPAWLSDHPDTDERIRKATVRAALARVTARNQTNNYRDRYLDAIDGMAFGEDPKQGTLRDGVFYHTGLGFAFDVPGELKIQNTPIAVIGVKGEELGMIFGGMEWTADQSLGDYTENVWLQLTAGAMGSIDRIKETEINGMAALVATKRLVSRMGPLAGAPAALDIKTFVYRFDDKTVAHMSFMTPSDATRSNAEMIDAIGNSFRRMSPQEVAAFKLKRFQLTRVSPEDNLGSLAEKMAFDDFKLARFKTLNAIETQDQLQKIRRVKLVTYGD